MVENQIPSYISNHNFDFRRAILTNPDVLPTTTLSGIWHNDFWGTPLANSGSHGSYRPLCTLSFRLNYLLAEGFRPFGFHLGNVLLHTLSTYLVVKLARLLLRSTFSVILCGLLFSAHPIHTEAVAGIVGRADIIACVFYLVSFLSYVEHVKYRTWLTSAKGVRGAWLQCLGYLILCLLSSAAAMLSKETGVTVLILCAIYDLLVNCKSLRHLLTKVSFQLCTSYLVIIEKQLIGSTRREFVDLKMNLVEGWSLNASNH